jgi:hypothetical protein
LLEGVELGEQEEIRVEAVVQKEEPDCEIQEAELLGISLLALAGAPAPRTMRLIGRVGSQTMVILIDTGNTQLCGSKCSKEYSTTSTGRKQANGHGGQ